MFYVGYWIIAYTSKLYQYAIFMLLNAKYLTGATVYRQVKSYEIIWLLLR